MSIFFFFNDTATTEIYTLSLHDALPICLLFESLHGLSRALITDSLFARERLGDRKSTRLNSSHLVISYAVFCLKKKKQDIAQYHDQVALQRIRTGRRVTRISGCDATSVC